MVEDSSSAPPANASNSGRANRRRLSWVAVALLSLAVVIALLAGVALLATQSEFGGRLLWRAASAALPDGLSGEYLGGSLGSGVQLRNLRYRDESLQIEIDKLESAWHLQLAPLELQVQSLRIDKLGLTLFPSPSPPSLPAQIVLPLAFDLQSASIGELTVQHDADATHYRDIRLHARSTGAQHDLRLDRMLTPLGNATASVQLGGLPPFDLSAAAELRAPADVENYRIDVRAKGSLAAFDIQLNATGDKFNGQAAIAATPFAAVPFRHAQAEIHHLDPKNFNAQWPRADLEIRAVLEPTGATVDNLPVIGGEVSVDNAQVGAIDRGLLPLIAAKAEVKLDARTQQLSRLSVKLADEATLTGSGERQSSGQVRLALQADKLDLHGLHSRLTTSRLSGPLAVNFDGDRQVVELKLAEPELSITAQATIDPKRIALSMAKLQADKAELTVNGMLERDAQMAYSLSGTLKDFNPARFVRLVPRGKALGNASLDAHINADFDARGALHGEPSAKLQFTIRDSDYDKLPLTGGGVVHVVGKRLLPSDASLSIAGNTLRLEGSFGAPADRMSFGIDAPALDRLGLGLTGLLRAQGKIAGTLEQPMVDASVRAEKFALGAYGLTQLNGTAHVDATPAATADARLSLKLEAQGARLDEIDLNRVRLDLDGTRGRHTLRLDTSGRLQGNPLDLNLAAQGSLSGQMNQLAWDGVLQTLENRGQARVSLAAPLALSVAPGRLELGAGRLMVAQTAIDLKRFAYSERGIRTAGEFSALDLGHWLALRQQVSGSRLPVDTDLVLDGSWDMTLADNAAGYLQIARRGGDVRVAGDKALGLSALSLRADLRGTRVALAAQAEAKRLGNLNAQGEIGLQTTDGRVVLSEQAPLVGRVDAVMPQLQTVAALAGPRVALNGRAEIALAVAGSLGAPMLSGTAAANDMTLALYDQGVQLHDGMARISLDNNVAELQQLEFRGGSGSLRASGRLPLKLTDRALNLTVVADKLQLLSNPARQMSLSGQATAANADGQVRIAGAFVVDQALFSRPDTPAPTLDDDVVVIRDRKLQAVRKEAESSGVANGASASTPQLDIAVDLGKDFRFKGSGADLRLTGSLALRGDAGGLPQTFGTITVADGRYEAFGTEIEIEHGVLDFQGPPRNPTVNLLAMRRKQDVAAGVQVTGNLQRPRVQLVSEPEVSQEEKLSWLVFGHGVSSGEPGQSEAQARAVASGAALGLLSNFGGKPIAKKLGLDKASIARSDFGPEGTQALNLGKEISDRLYIGYEQSLASAKAVVTLTYELTRYWSVIVRGGTVSGVEMLYNRRFDSSRQGE